MNTDSLAKAFAEAFFKIAQAENKLNRVDEEFFYFKKILEANASLKNFLKNPKTPSSAKKDALKEIFGKSISPATFDELNLIIDEGKAGLLLQICEEFSKFVSATLNRVRAEVTTAIPLSPKLSTQLRDKLSRLVGKDVVITAFVDESIVGGIIVNINGEVIDGSLRHRLEEVREKIAGTATRSEQR